MTTAVYEIRRHHINGDTSHHYISVQGYAELMPALDRFASVYGRETFLIELWRDERLLVRRIIHSIT